MQIYIHTHLATLFMTVTAYSIGLRSTLK
jgi:hypothetical protein